MTLEKITLRGARGIALTADAAGPTDGRPIVFLHGGGQTRHSWRASLAGVAEAGWRGYGVDLRGHGDSAWAEDGDYKIDTFAKDIVAVAAGLRVPAVFVGASLGGIASLIAVGELGVPARALVLVDIAPKMEPTGSKRVRDFMNANAEQGFGSLDEVADAIAAYNTHRPRPTDLAGLQKNVRQRADGRWVWHWDPRVMIGKGGLADDSNPSMTGVDRMEHAARSLTIPTLLVRGQRSDILSSGGVEEFLKLVPQAKFVDVEGAGHMIAGDRNDVFNRAIVEFLATL